MAQSTERGPFVSIYERRIGDATNTNEVVGYWVFLAGVVFGFLGYLTFYMTDAATTGRGVGYALAALAPALLMAGAVLRFPLRKMATTLVGVGLSLTIAAIAWFLVIFPGGWSLTTGNSAVIMPYVAGIGIIGIAGSVVPLATDARDAALSAAKLRAETAETEKKDAAAAFRESESDRLVAERERGEADEELAELREVLADTAADEADLAAQLRALRTSQARFELYQDRSDEWRWRLRHRNGNIVADGGEGYTQKHNAQKGMQSVRRNALGAEVRLVDRAEELPDETEEFAPPEERESRATFETYEDEAGKQRWRLRHDNGNIIADSGGGYSSGGALRTAISSVQGYVPEADYLRFDPTGFEVYRDAGGEYRWRLIHKNGNILADGGEGYSRRHDAKRAVDRLRERAWELEFEVYEDQAGEYRWRALGSNDQIVADSGEGYASNSGANEAVERVREHAPDADVLDAGRAAFEIYEDTGGEYRWRLRHRNGNILADCGEGYSDRHGVYDAIESVKRNAANAESEAA